MDLNTAFGRNDCTIRTFHAFAYDILQEFAVHLGLTDDFQLMTPASEAVFLQRHLYDLPLKRFRPSGSPDGCVRMLLTYVGRLQDACISPEVFREAVSEVFVIRIYVYIYR